MVQYGAASSLTSILQKSAWNPIFPGSRHGRAISIARDRARFIPDQATNIADRLNVINFASIFSGTATAPRSVAARLRVSF